MKIASLYCSGCSCEVPIDHYRSGECPSPPAPLAWLLGIQKKETEDRQHCDNKMTASRMTSCPRKTAIEDNIAVPNVNLESFNSTTWGTAIHAFLKENAPKGTIPEVEVSGVLFVGTRYEIAVSGSIDLLIPDFAALLDYKLHNVFTQQKGFKNANTPKLEPRIQLSIYNLLSPIPLERGAIWNGAMIAKAAGCKPWFRTPIQFMDEAEILAAKPFDGQRTIAEMIDIWKKFQADLKTMDVRAAVAKIPLVGAEMAPFCCEYCVVEPECTKMARGIR